MAERPVQFQGTFYVDKEVIHELELEPGGESISISLMEFLRIALPYWEDPNLEGHISISYG